MAISQLVGVGVERPPESASFSNISVFPLSHRRRPGCEALSDAAISVLMDLVMVVVVGFVLFFQSSALFLVAVVTVPLSTGIVWAFSKPFATRYRKLRGESADVQSSFIETTGGIAAIKAMPQREYAYFELPAPLIIGI